jgi:hypothetical protein
MNCARLFVESMLQQWRAGHILEAELRLTENCAAPAYEYLCGYRVGKVVKIHRIVVKSLKCRV